MKSSSRGDISAFELTSMIDFSDTWKESKSEYYDLENWQIKQGNIWITTLIKSQVQHTIEKLRINLCQIDPTSIAGKKPNIHTCASSVC